MPASRPGPSINTTTSSARTCRIPIAGSRTPTTPRSCQWLSDQAAHTRAYLDALPGRDAIAAALRAVVGLPHSGLPVHRGEHWFRTANDGEQQQDVLLVSAAPFGAGRVLLDPNPLDRRMRAPASRRPCRRPDGAPAWPMPTSRRAATGGPGACATSRPATTSPTRCGGRSSPSRPGCRIGSGFVYGRFDAPAGRRVRDVECRAVARRCTGSAPTQADDELVFGLPDEPDITFWRRDHRGRPLARRPRHPRHRAGRAGSGCATWPPASELVALIADATAALDAARHRRRRAW